jgi:hypothetical protein
VFRSKSAEAWNEPCNTVSVKDNDRDGQLVTIEMTTLDRMIEHVGRPYHIKISANSSDAAVFFVA